MLVFVKDKSGTMPRKTPKRRLAQTRAEMWEFVSEMGHKVTARNIQEANEISVANGWGTIVGHAA